MENFLVFSPTTKFVRADQRQYRMEIYIRSALAISCCFSLPSETFWVDISLLFHDSSSAVKALREEKKRFDIFPTLGRRRNDANEIASVDIYLSIAVKKYTRVKEMKSRFPPGL